MKINADDLRTHEPAWDLTVTIKGIDYPVRQLTLREFNQLTSQIVSGAKPKDLLLGLIAGEKKPDLSGLDDDRIDEISTAIGSYWAAWIEKKRQAIRTAVIRMAQANLTSPNSLPQS